MSAKKKGRAVLIVGATGLVGGECLRLLLDDPTVSRVVALARRPLPASVKSPKLEACLTDFDRLVEQTSLFRVQQVVCALGTTIHQAGSPGRFRDVDYGLSLEVARMAASQGVKHFLLVSALGADPRSFFFYSRVKGELEAAVGKLPFRSLTIVRPSLILGDRREQRLVEELGKRLAFLVPERYRPVEARDVAAALAAAGRGDAPGVRIVESHEIRALASAA